MSIINASPLLGAGADGYQIERSLRFNSPDSAYLNRTPASAGNRQSWTWSGWVKLSDVSTSAKVLFQADTTTIDALQINNAQLDVTLGAVNFATTAVYRDPGAWYHIVWNYNGSTTVVYANNVSAGSAAKTGDTKINNNIVHYIGTNSTARYFSGYLTEINFIDGQALTPSSFGETDTITGVWKPKKYAGTYGANGFYLKFADNSGTTSTTLGKDSSGNGNNWTPNNFSVTAGAGNDSMIDTPTPYADGGNGRGNYCTLNPLDIGSTSIALSNGNLDFTKSGINFSPSRGTLGVTTGKWYFEMTVNNSNLTQVGVSNDFNIRASGGNTSVSSTGGIGAAWDSRGFLYQTGSSGPGYGYTFTTNDVVMIAFDLASGKIWFGKNGTWNTGDPAAGTSPAFTASGYSALFPFVNGESGGGGTCNFGQRSFSYTPPSGFLALNTQNLPEPSIKKPSSYFNTVLWTGNTSTAGVTQAITGVGFASDFVWAKTRNQVFNHFQYDSVRGVGSSGKLLQSNTTAAELTNGEIDSLDADGFTVKYVNTNTLNWSSSNNVAWCWKKSATPGFDIVTYTGTGVSGLTVNHSLGVTPAMIIGKNRSGAAQNWQVWHQSMGDNVMQLNLTNAQVASTSNSVFLYSSINSTSFQVGTNASVNGSSTTQVAYLWSEVAGFSKFGSYTGNGSTDGPFVACNFRPRWVIFKSSTQTNTDWVIFDGVRSTSNVVGLRLDANSSGQEVDSSGQYADFLSNGFKLRGTGANNNSNGQTYIFAAFAESPFKYSLAR